MEYLWYSNWLQSEAGYWQPYLISCPVVLPPEQVPLAVAVTSRPCQQATHSLKVVTDSVSSHDGKSGVSFSVCSPPLDEPGNNELGVQMVEWLEFLRLFGVQRVSLLKYSLHASGEEVLKYYEQASDRAFRVESTPMALPGNHPNSQAARWVQALSR